MYYRCSSTALCIRQQKTQKVVSRVNSGSSLVLQTTCYAICSAGNCSWLIILFLPTVVHMHASVLRCPSLIVVLDSFFYSSSWEWQLCCAVFGISISDSPFVFVSFFPSFLLAAPSISAAFRTEHFFAFCPFLPHLRMVQSGFPIFHLEHRIAVYESKLFFLWHVIKSCKVDFTA